MFQGICADVLDAKWLALSELDFPINAKKIAATDCLNEDLRQFFFAEINHYSKNVLNSLTINTNIAPELATNSDGDAVANILYDWVGFSEEETHNLLKFAVETEIFFMISPAKCLADFLFKSNPNDEATSETAEQPIENIINELNFISDKQGILSALKIELEELANIQKVIERNKFVNVANDIIFNIYQKQSIEDFLLPCQHYLEFSAKEDIPADFVELFLQERDLTGVLTEIKNYASANEKQSLSYEELYNEVGRLTGKLPETSEENVPEVEESLAETEEDIQTDLDLAEENNDVDVIEDLAETEAIEELAEEETVPEEFTEAEETKEILVEESIKEIEKIEDVADITEDTVETVEFEDNTEVIEDVADVEDIQIEEEAVELPEEEIIEETEVLADNSDVTEEIIEEVEFAEEPAKELPTNDFVEEFGEEEIADATIEEEPEVIAEVEVEEIEVADMEADATDEVEDVEAQIEEENVSEEEDIETVAGVVVPADFEELAEAVEQEVDNAIAELDKEDAATEVAYSEAPKVEPVVAPPTPAMQEVMANSSSINSKMAEMRSNYINSKVAEMRTLGKTLFEIEHNYLEMETEYIAKILNLLKE